MSARVSIQPSQGQALCPRGGSSSHYPKPLQTPRRILFRKRAGTSFTCGRLVANNKTRFRLHNNTQTSKWYAGYTTSEREPPPPDVRSHGILGFDAVSGEEIASSSSGYAQSSDVRIPVNGNSAAGLHHDAGDVATRDGFQDNVVASETTQATGLDDDDLDYYVPVPGHRVIGVVVSGNYAKLDVDIGAAKLGHLHVQDLLPLDKLSIDESKWTLADDAGEGGDDGASPGTPSLGLLHVLYDEEVYTYEAPEPLVVDVGTVLEMEVVGQTMSGNPLLSARKAAQRLQWERVMQIKEEKEPLQVKILNFNKSGVIAAVEGLRAFLPLAEFIKYPNAAKGESLEAYVGRTLWVAIAYAKEIRGNITLSEKDVWIKRNLQLGSLLKGTVTKIFNFGALVQVNETDIWGMIHISNIADGRITQVSDVFEIGEQVKVILVKSPIPDRLAFSTGLLESEPGLMLRDKERVFREAEKTAIALRNEHPEWNQSPDDDAEDDTETPGTFSKPVANLEWLEFQQG